MRTWQPSSPGSLPDLPPWTVPSGWSLSSTSSFGTRSPLGRRADPRASGWGAASSRTRARPSSPTPSSSSEGTTATERVLRLAENATAATREEEPVDPEEPEPGLGKRYQSWFGTWIPAPSDSEARRSFDALPECQTLVVGKEVCPTTGTRHLQFCLQLKSSTRTFQHMCRLLPKCWIRPLKKPIAAAVTYCRGTTAAKLATSSPNEMLYDLYKPSRRGPKRTREVASGSAWEACVQGDPRPILAELDAERQVQHCKRIKEAVLTLPLLKGASKERTPPYFIWIFGNPGSGKTSFAKLFVKRWAASSTYTVSPPREGAKGVWMDGYLPAVHEVVLLDDARPHWLGAAELLTLCNSTNRSVEWKGASTPFASSVMLLTTTEPPWEFYSQYPLEAAQVARRVNMLVEIGPSSLVLTERPTAVTSGAISSSFQPPECPYPVVAADLRQTASSATSAGRVEWGSLRPGSDVASWLKAMNAPRAAPCTQGRVWTMRTSPEGGSVHRMWEQRAREIVEEMRLERAYEKYRET